MDAAAWVDEVDDYAVFIAIFHAEAVGGFEHGAFCDCGVDEGWYFLGSRHGDLS